MKLTMLFSFLLFMTSWGTSLSQTTKLSLQLKNVPVQELIQEIEDQTEFYFLYQDDVFRKEQKVTIQSKDASVESILHQMAEQASVNYQIIDRQIVLLPQGETEVPSVIKGQTVSQQQKKTITGKVTDSSGVPMPGVTVVVKGTTSGTVSDSQGNFSLAIPSDAKTLQFSFVGMKAREEAISGKSIFNIIMEEETVGIEEVVAVGYGTMRRSDLTGSVASVKVDEQQASQINTVDKLLQGRAAGVYVNSGSAAPGGAVNVRIRGASSLSGGNEPLYVVDGVIINTASQDVDNSLRAGTNPGNSSQEAQNGLTAINPQDIENIEILKDASATAIYGSRAANGVVIITTKQGKKGKAQVQYMSVVEMAKVGKTIPMLNGKEFAAFRNKTEEMQGRPALYDLTTIQPIDWQEDIYGTGITTNNRLNISGATEKTNYFLAVGYLSNNGVISTAGLSQSDLRFNFTHDVSNKFKVSYKAGLIYRTNSMTQSTEQMGSASNSIIRSIFATAPLLGDQTQAEFDQEIEGPRVWLKEYDDISKELRTTQSLSMDYQLSKAFKFSVLGGVDLRVKDRHRWFGKDLGQGKNANGQLGYSFLKNFTYNTQAILNYNETFGKHRIDGTLGVTYDKSNIESSYTVNEDFWTEDLRIYGMGVGARVLPFTEEFTGSSILSALARFVYSYNNKYVLTATARADGSSRFAAGNKWGYFPSVAFAWRASDEEFIKNLNIFSNLKPRLGFGMTGNQAISPYATLTRFSPSYYASENESVVVGAKPSIIANKELTWESTSQYNVGVDMGFLDNRITFNVDLYQKKTKDLLQQMSVPTSTGFTSMWVNRGSIENKGLELALDGIILDGEFKWNMGGNIAFNRNKIVDIGLPEGEFGNMTLKAFLGKDVAGGNEFKMPANIFAEGHPMAMFFGYQTKGIYQTADLTTEPLTLSGVPLVPGDIYFVDQNKDGNINDADKVIIGNPNPKFTYGLTTDLSYKRFSLTIFLNGVYGNQIANGNKLKIEDTQAGLNVSKDAYFKAWTAEQPGNIYPRLLYKNGWFTDRILEDGSFLRLGMITLGYKPDVKGLKFLSALEVYVTGKNLLTITNYSGYDPEVNSFTNDPLRTGVDWSSYPNTKSFTLGLNVSF
jgi:TonB-linked SusC/RagA family outer membrane protein